MTERKRFDYKHRLGWNAKNITFMNQDDEAAKKEYEEYTRLLSARQTLTPEQLERMVAYLKGTRNSIDDAAALVGTTFDQIDEPSMIDFNTRISQCVNCFLWLDISQLNEKDECYKCKDSDVNGFLDNTDGQD